MNDDTVSISNLWKGILLCPVSGALDSTKGQALMDSILTSISTFQAEVIIVDIMSVPAVDTAIATQLIKLTRATELMGCKCFLSGISPAIAQTIIQLGVSMEGISTKSTIEDALKEAFEGMGLEVVDKIEKKEIHPNPPMKHTKAA